MRTNRPVLGKRCLEVLSADTADIADIADIRLDGAVIRTEYRESAHPGLSATDRNLLALCRTGHGGADAAMRIENVHARVLAIDACGGWESVAKVVHSDGEGDLLAAEWLSTRILRVRCPSTGQVYHLHVPATCRTATAARDWINRGVKTEVRS